MIVATIEIVAIMSAKLALVFARSAAVACRSAAAEARSAAARRVLRLAKLSARFQFILLGKYL
jgi:hypothetical protein